MLKSLVHQQCMLYHHCNLWLSPPALAAAPVVNPVPPVAARVPPVVARATRSNRRSSSRRPGAGAQSATAGGGRGQGFLQAEMDKLLDEIESIEPIGQTEWELVTVNFNRAFPNLPDQDQLALRRKFNTMHRKQVPTGDPNCPPEIVRAKQLCWMLVNKADIVDEGKDDDDEEDRANEGDDDDNDDDHFDGDDDIGGPIILNNAAMLGGTDPTNNSSREQQVNNVLANANATAAVANPRAGVSSIAGSAPVPAAPSLATINHKGIIDSLIEQGLCTTKTPKKTTLRRFPHELPTASATKGSFDGMIEMMQFEMLQAQRAQAKRDLEWEEEKRRIMLERELERKRREASELRNVRIMPQTWRINDTCPYLARR